MKPDNPWEVVVILVSLAVVITLCEVVVRFDERRLSEERLERAWPPSSRDNALIGLSMLITPLLGVFAVWFHFFRTRSRALWPPWKWSGWGLLLGTLAALTITFLWFAVVLTLAMAVGLEME